jgi:hypothetical protein
VKGANLHGYSKRFKQNALTNIPELMHNLIIKTSSYGEIDYKNLEKEEEIDKIIHDIEYDYTDDILKMNEHLKLNRK